MLISVVVLGLKCHKCASTKSWEDCSTELSTLSCPQSDAVCYKAHFSTNDGTIQVFGKSCARESNCNKETNTICKEHLGPSTCEVTCCEDDMCNGSPVAWVSGIAVMSCILVMILFW